METESCHFCPHIVVLVWLFHMPLYFILLSSCTLIWCSQLVSPCSSWYGSNFSYYPAKLLCAFKYIILVSARDKKTCILQSSTHWTYTTKCCLYFTRLSHQLGNETEWHGKDLDCFYFHKGYILHRSLFVVWVGDYLHLGISSLVPQRTIHQFLPSWLWKTEQQTPEPCLCSLQYIFSHLIVCAWDKIINVYLTNQKK